MRTSLAFPTTSSEPSLITREFSAAKCTNTTNFPIETMEVPLSVPFSTERRKILSRPDDFWLYRQLGVDFFYNSEILCPSLTIRLIRARTIIHMISDNPSVRNGTVDCSLYSRHITLQNDYHKKWMHMFAEIPSVYNCLEGLDRLSSFLPDKASLSKKKKHFRPCCQSLGGYCKQYKPCIFLDRTLKFHSGTNNWSKTS